MSSLLACAQPATGSPDVFITGESPALLLKKLAATPRLSPVTPASRLEVRPAPDMTPSGILTLDNLTGGLPRGCLTEICGPASSGRTSVLLTIFAAATHRQEACALVDVSDSLDVHSAAIAGIEFKNLLWIRCDPDKQGSSRKQRSTSLRGSSPDGKSRNDFNSLDQALRATDLLLQSGGFGLVAIDLGDVTVQTARRIPLTSWFRFRRAVENTPTVLLVLARSSCARTCASLVVELQSSAVTRRSSGKLSAVRSQRLEKIKPAHGQIFTEMEIRAELLRSRLERKPVQSVTSFVTNTEVAISEC